MVRILRGRVGARRVGHGNSKVILKDPNGTIFSASLLQFLVPTTTGIYMKQLDYDSFSLRQALGHYEKHYQ